MDETVIKLDNVTVRFRIPHEKIPTFREYAIRWIKRRGVTFSHFNALDDVSFSIKKGQTVGIIGSNGAGKSTLLKVISRVIRPTEGRVFLKGRIAPLLELGAGFDYEMTGRENIFLNGAVSARPDALIDQLKPGGRLVGIVTDRGVGKAHIFLKSAGGHSSRIAFDATVALLPGFESIPSFVFQ